MKYKQLRLPTGSADVLRYVALTLVIIIILLSVALLVCCRKRPEKHHTGKATHTHTLTHTHTNTAFKICRIFYFIVLVVPYDRDPNVSGPISECQKSGELRTPAALKKLGNIFNYRPTRSGLMLSLGSHMVQMLVMHWPKTSYRNPHKKQRQCYNCRFLTEKYLLPHTYSKA
ncbi:hypothetical protein GOODEAATRI_026242 [Goodea atripinnis]|uniref:Uncharacterized protein n=1 Tax=Goodea atripinnis TaxID=208336 RepID=A0ABV0NZT3_9TELE